MNKVRVLLIFFLSLFQIINNIAYARFANHQDANVEIEFYNRDITVNADGSSSEIIEIQAKILKDSGRNIWANYPLIYNSNISKLSIITAKTIYQGREYEVKDDLIEDKPLASSPSGFDQNNQITLAFPNAEVGSKLYLKYKYDIKTSELDNFYNTNFIFGDGIYFKDARINLESKIPLYLSVNDPEQCLAIKKDKNLKFTKLQINLKKPAFKTVIEESEASYQLDPKNIPWVLVSSINKWSDFSNKLSPSYYKVIEQELPESFAEILLEAKKYNTDEARINIVTSRLAEKIQYMGDWKTIAGRFNPHNLIDIANSQLGDCKDFTASSGAILARLGYKVEPTLVMRGLYSRTPPFSLPSFYHSNHVFLKVNNKQGKHFWIDPTNFVSMATGIFPDISNKEVLVMAKDKPRLEKTPKTSASNMQFIVDQEWDLEKENVIKAKGSIQLKGERAISFTGAYLMTSKEVIENAIFEMVGDQYNQAIKNIDVPDLSSRIVKDLVFNYEYSQKNIPTITNLGPAYGMPMTSWKNSFLKIKPDMVSDVFIGPSKKIKITTKINNFKIAEKVNLNCELNSKWLNVKREIKKEPSFVTIVDDIEIKDFLIKNSDLQTKAYKDLKHDLEKYFQSVALVMDIS